MKTIKFSTGSGSQTLEEVMFVLDKIQAVFYEHENHSHPNGLTTVMLQSGNVTFDGKGNKNVYDGIVEALKEKED